MTYNPTVPLNSDSPSIFPAQGQANFTRLQTLVGADHQFNLTAAADDGYHNLVHLTQQAPAGALAATGRLYAKSSAGTINLFYMNDAGTEFQMSPGMPIRAAVNFKGIAPVVVRSSYNVSSVTRLGTGRYQINFTRPMPDANYVVQATGMRDSNVRICPTSVEGSSTYSNSMATTFVRVNSFDSSANLVDVLMMSVTIFSVT